MCKACRENDISLVGGETAEMPGTYQVGEHDIVGSITGVVERSKIITGDQVKAGDIAIGIESSGLHTNGYSLARKILFTDNNYSVTDIIPELGSKSLGEILLAPHRSYAKPVFEILNAGIEINAMAHITGGGFIENIPRVLPENLSIEINKGSWKVLPIYNFMQKISNVPEQEMYRVFNMGIGLILIIDPKDKAAVETILSKYTDTFSEIGKVVVGNKKVILK
jgi:phosphoribosylformylglycinamidine cyclo-ligase